MSDDEKKKKPFYKKWWFILIAIVAVVVVINSGGEGGGSSQAVAKKYGIGDVAPTKYFNVKVTNATLSKDKLGSYGKPPAEGSVYVILDVEWENIGTDASGIGDGQLLTQLNGQEVSIDKSVTHCGDDEFLCTQRINPASIFKGKVAFEVSERLDFAGMQYAPDRTMFSSQKKIRIDLGLSQGG